MIPSVGGVPELPAPHCSAGATSPDHPPPATHYTNQTTLFSRKQWVTERFTQAQITSDPQLATTILRGQPT